MLPSFGVLRNIDFECMNWVLLVRNVTRSKYFHCYVGAMPSDNGLRYSKAGANLAFSVNFTQLNLSFSNMSRVAFTIGSLVLKSSNKIFKR